MRFLEDSSVSTMQAYFVLHFFSQRHRFLCNSHVEVCKALRLTSELPPFYAHSSWCLWISHHQDRWSETPRNFLTLSSFRIFDSPLWLFFAFRRIKNIFLNFWSQSVWSGGRLFSCQSPARPMYIHPVVFHPIRWTLWNLSTYLTILDLHRRYNNRRYFFTAWHPGSCL